MQRYYYLCLSKIFELHLLPIEEAKAVSVVAFLYLLWAQDLGLGWWSWHVKGGTKSLLHTCVNKSKQRLHTVFRMLCLKIFRSLWVSNWF